MDQNDSEELVGLQNSFFSSGRTLGLNARKEALRSLHGMIRSNESRLQKALYADLGKGRSESYFTEIAPLLNETELALGKLHRWHRPKKVKTAPVNLPGSSRVERWPYGVTLIASPWNFPLYLLCIPLVSALAGGNCALLKPSEQAPHTSALVCELVNRTFDKRLVCAVEGGPEVLDSLIKAGPDFIFFTGGSNAGRSVMREASNKLIPLVLELGGKTPCIVTEDANLKRAARRIVWGKFVNAGQICVAPDFVCVHKSVADRLMELCCEAVRRFYGTDPRFSSDYARIVNVNHYRRIIRLLGDGEIFCGGDTDEKELYIAPTLIREPGWDSRVMNEEIFGPLLPFMVYSDQRECISRLKSLSSPLALYLFTRRKGLERTFQREVKSGMVCVNGTIHSLIGSALPFGGVGESGMGRYHGENGFRAFTYERSVLEKASSFDWPFIYPPYRFFSLLKGIVRRVIRT
ncbi:MAG: aldehyde dehydrogenase family protein [Chitinispirillaceae bacterium]